MVRLLFRKLRRDVRAQRAQFVAVIVTLGLGIALFGASYGAFQNLQASYDRLFVDLRFPQLWAVGGNADAIASAASADPDVQAAVTRSVADASLRPSGGHKLFGRVVGMPAGEHPAVGRVLVEAGSYLDPAQPNGVLVERHLADHFGLAPGDHLDVLGSGGWQAVDVLGIVASAEYLWPARSRQEILVSPDDFGVIFAPETLTAALPGARRETLITFTSGVSPVGAAAEVRLVEAARAAGADTYTRAEQPSNAALSEDIRGFGEMSVLFPLLFLSAAVMGTYILLSRLVSGQREQIGMLRATGIGARTIFVHYLGYGVFAGALGAIPGAVAGVLLGGAITGAYTSAISVPATVHQLNAGPAIVGVAMGILAGLVAAAAPAIAALRTTPAEAMRGGAPAGRGGRGLLERVLPPMSRLPARWRMTLRNVGRNRGRSAYTAAGVMLALTLVLVAWGMIDTIDVLLKRQFEDVQTWDASLRLTTPVDATALSSLAAVEGVALVEPLAQAPVVVAHGDRTYASELLAYEPATRMHSFRSASGGTLPAPTGDGVLLGVAMRDLLGVQLGDTVTLTLPQLGASAPTRVAGFVSEPLGTYAYASLATVESAAGPAANAVQVRYAAGADRAAMRERLTALPTVAAVTDARSLVDAVQSLLGLFYAIVGAMLVFGGLMASALIFNTMSANVAERAAETASLRASGLSRATLARLIAAENLILVVIGIPFGLIAGYFVGRFFMASFSSDLFQFGLEVHARTFVFAAVGMLLVALVAQLPALRSAGNVDLARVVRQRST